MKNCPHQTGHRGGRPFDHETGLGNPAPAGGGLPTLEFLGIRLNPLSRDQLNLLVQSSVESGEKRVFGHHNLHSLYLFHHDAKLRDFYRQSFVAHIDGMSLVFLARTLGLPASRTQRVTYVDWIRPLLGMADLNRWRVFYLGSRQGVADKAADSLRQEYPALSITVHHGYFDPAPGSPENRAVLDDIARCRPHLLFVGMGMPRQERWVLENLEQLQANVVLTSGACFDYLAGAVPTPPRWMGRAGLEWLFRLCAEPRRLWRRYLVEPLFILWLLARAPARRGGKEASRCDT